MCHWTCLINERGISREKHTFEYIIGIENDRDSFHHLSIQQIYSFYADVSRNILNTVLKTQYVSEVLQNKITEKLENSHPK